MTTPIYLRNLPERVHGKVKDIRITRAPGIATGQIGLPTTGRVFVCLWRVKGSLLPWRVRIGEKLSPLSKTDLVPVLAGFRDETEAVTFFLDTVQKVADDEINWK